MVSFLYEIDAYNPDMASVETLRFSTNGYVTKPSDTPANTEYKDVVISAGSFASYMFGNARTTGQSSSGFGDFIIANDRSYDYLLEYGFDRRAFRVYSISSKRAAYSSATLIFSGLIDSVTFSWSEISFSLKSSLAYLDENAAAQSFLGNNASSSDYEGDGDLLGQVKPFVYGKVYNIAPPLVNKASLLYATNFNASGSPIAVHSFNAVRDGEVSLTAGSDFATIALLIGSTPASGAYNTCLAKGMFKLRTAPTYVVTCDVTEKSADADMTPAQLVKRLIADRSPDLDSGDFDSASVTSLDGKIAAVEGIYVAENKRLMECADDLLVPLGCALIGKLDGSLAFTRLEAPSTSSSTLEEDEIFKEGFNLTTEGVPYWRFIVGYNKNYTTQDEGSVAGAAITSGRVEFSKLEYRKEIVENTALKTAYLAAGEYEVQSLLTDVGDAGTEASRQAALRGVFRKIWEVPTSRSTILELGTTVTLQVSAFDMTNGWDGVIIGYEYDFGKNYVTYQVYG